MNRRAVDIAYTSYLWERSQVKKPHPAPQDFLIPGTLAKTPPEPPTQRGKGSLCHWSRNTTLIPTSFSKLTLLSPSNATCSFRLGLQPLPLAQSLNGLERAGLLTPSFTTLEYHCKATLELFLTTVFRTIVPTPYARHPSGYPASITSS